jgi:hypothetical protein
MCAHNTPEEIHEYIHKGSVRNARKYSSNNTTNTEECDNVALIPVGRHVCDASYAWPSGIKNYIEEQVIHYDMIAPMSMNLVSSSIVLNIPMGMYDLRVISITSIRPFGLMTISIFSGNGCLVNAVSFLF